MNHLKSGQIVQKRQSNRLQHPGVFLLVLVSLVWGCKSRTEDSQLAAIVGNRSITIEDLIQQYGLDQNLFLADGQVDPELVREAARRWATEQILIQEAVKRNLDQDQFFIDQLENLRKGILIAMLYDQMTKSISVDSLEIQQEYETHRAEFITAHDQIDLMYILAPNRNLADRVRRELQAGKSYDEVLAFDNQFSGEEVGWVMEKDLNPKIAKAAFALVPGGVSYPLKYDTGSDYIVMVCRQRRQAGTVLPLSEVETKVQEQILLRKKTQTEKTYRDSLWAAYNPRILVD